MRGMCIGAYCIVLCYYGDHADRIVVHKSRGEKEMCIKKDEEEDVGYGGGKEPC